MNPNKTPTETLKKRPWGKTISISINQLRAIKFYRNVLIAEQGRKNQKGKPSTTDFFDPGREGGQNFLKM